MPTIQFMQPIVMARIIDAAQLRIDACDSRNSDCELNPPSAIRHPPSDDLSKELQRQKNELGQLLKTVNSIAAALNGLHQETLASNRAEIARLAIEIARKILMCKAGKGDYDIQAIVEEALKRAPTRQKVVIRLNPEDLPRCQQLQRENPDSPFAEPQLTADWSIGRGECLVETPKGIVKSFIEEHLEQITEALQKAE
ncbi:MAG: hypothetical protein A2Y77_06885 [Planctomycetes bacterium RBG_13_62_9]|nr:MAG: hypothetical protein A2Y77_06885 [Planctomycetes bacterium RBG_13_62_9]